ncbi:MAG: pyridoxamine 5'-phosphate oxidase family protein [Acidobacteria bacterium]|nr:pyridoxamine 5'-phosphate oxidase family protein [Acidobacteriota bacterium]
MSVQLTTDQVWREVSRQIFAVLATVTDSQEPRCSGVVYVVRDRTVFIGVERSSWKALHISRNSHVSLTVSIPKRIPFFPWVRIPPATISFQGEASIHSPDEIPADVGRALLRGLEGSPELMERACVIGVQPRGRFLTYGVGVSLWTMRNPEQARGHAPV